MRAALSFSALRARAKLVYGVQRRTERVLRIVFRSSIINTPDVVTASMFLRNTQSLNFVGDW
jgi:hypothetical protein